MAQNALTDSLPRYDPKSQDLAYNNTTDRMRIELPQIGDPAASGCVVTVSASPVDQVLVKKKFGYNTVGDVDTIKEALIVTPSGSPCKLSTFTYNVNFDTDYIVESLGTW